MSKRKAEQLLLPLPAQGREFVVPGHAFLGGKVVHYTVKRSARRRSISLRVDEDGLRVGAPVGASERAIGNVLRQHGEWIVQKLSEWQARRTPALRWTDGDVLMLHGEPLTLRLVDGALGARVVDDELFAPRVGDAAAAVVGWLKEEALAYFSERTAHFCARLMVDVPHVRLSTARTRWGSCHIGGRIHLNWRLIQMPLPLVDYVVAHEVAHLKEMNHSARFWRVVASLVPDYLACRRNIRHEGHRYLVL